MKVHFVVLSVAVWISVVFAVEPTCGTFRGGMANNPVPSVNGSFSSSSGTIIAGCDVVDETRVDGASFSGPLTFQASKFVGGALLRSSFAELNVEESSWTNVVLDGSKFSGTLRIAGGTVDLSQGISIQANAVEIIGARGYYLNLASSYMGSLLVENSQIDELQCDSCLIGSLVIRNSTIDGLGFDHVVSSKVIIEDSAVFGGFFAADLVNGSSTPPLLAGRVNISNSVFDYANLAGIRHEGETGDLQIDSSSFEYANISGAYFVGASFVNTSFDNADLTNANFSMATLDTVSTNETKQNGTDFTDTMTTGPDSGSVCFPGYMTVELESGELRLMRELEIGDRVRVSPSKFSEVFLFSHRSETCQPVSFIRIETARGQFISLSPKHLLMVNGILRRAETVKVGDMVSSMENNSSENIFDSVIRISLVEDRSLYNPHTLDGGIVVNGIQASCYTGHVPFRLAHLALALDRALYSITGSSVTGSALHDSPPLLIRALWIIPSVLYG
uniref:Hint domain-containing protein n=1 Tax=Compsopogon caeruleus TaxID=31354 RepID=A0A7S1TEH9_9RHOD|mmetsp:Transcript_2332/g.4005  ORF Transcript_2332/g.4005 Transcript_2332/m.4005 type:complete len:504 (+) Transcript_2332:280-1791(+)|eukprot:CAMPEP_0184685070 /NCGR_PEP_ID=MMETSP0312-20130426/17540_1 /TAXON_ID=31354 /ORGANISM="Compsopogon coeruleus, Strain SAG 36.94" /LENGTH=503 /DNA_ID=CAMNT_0027138793 /DNA_START=190 /DNA_END=1701 /DNA_ORIENTATION=+